MNCGTTGAQTLLISRAYICRKTQCVYPMLTLCMRLEFEECPV